jgi:hypothetical protein
MYALVAATALAGRPGGQDHVAGPSGARHTLQHVHVVLVEVAVLLALADIERAVDDREEVEFILLSLRTVDVVIEVETETAGRPCVGRADESTRLLAFLGRQP